MQTEEYVEKRRDIVSDDLDGNDEDVNSGNVYFLPFL